MCFVHHRKAAAKICTVSVSPSSCLSLDCPLLLKRSPSLTRVFHQLISIAIHHCYPEQRRGGFLGSYGICVTNEEQHDRPASELCTIILTPLGLAQDFYLDYHGRKGETGVQRRQDQVKKLHSNSFLGWINSPISPIHKLNLRKTAQVVERTVDLESGTWILISFPLQTWGMMLWATREPTLCQVLC